MKNTFLIAALLIGLILFASGYADSRQHPAVGKTAPTLDVPVADSVMNLDKMRGDYVLVNFWSSTDAPSREAANLYTAWQRRNPDTDMKLIGINFDDSRALFREIVRIDSLEPSQEYYATGEQAKSIIRSYGLEKGYGSVLVDPDGKIMAYNPTDEDLNVIFDIAE